MSQNFTDVFRLRRTFKFCNFTNFEALFPVVSTDLFPNLSMSKVEKTVDRMGPAVEWSIGDTSK